MFGYVRPYRPELTLRQDALYKAHYCGVCRALSSIAFPLRALLRYDLAFLSVVKSGLKKEEPPVNLRACPARLKKMPAVEGEAARLCAQLHLLLSEEKCRDDARDGGALRLAAPLLRPFAKGPEQELSPLQEAILQMDEAQRALEEAGCADLDAAAQPFADLCGKFFAYGEEENNVPALTWMGQCLGRWIYWVDALDDYRKDEKKGRYNVLLRAGLSREQAAETLLPLLSLCADQALAAWDSLDAPRNDELVKNVLSLGLAHTAQDVAEERRAVDGSL